MTNASKRNLRRLTVLIVVAMDVAVLAAGRSWLGDCGRAIPAPHAYLSQVGTDRGLLVVTGAALWVLALWLAIGLAAVAASRLPGQLGEWGARVAGATLPRALTRLCAGALGASVLLGPVTAAVAGATPSGRPADRPVAAAAMIHDPRSDSVPTPAWPAGGATVTPVATPLPTPNWPHGSPPAPGSPPTPTRPSGPIPPARPTTPAPDSPVQTGRPVQVRPGDSLWLIAARRLGPGATTADIATAWQRWYAANRAAIGADPDLIHPGQVLVPPTDQP